MADLSRTVGRFQAAERTFCRWCNRRSRPTLKMLKWISKLGDGSVWVACSSLPVLAGRPDGWRLAGLMVGGTALNIGVYSLIKRKTTRQRPFLTLPDITLLERPLDRYSFPSGHTMHAAFFAALLPQHMPITAWLLWPFAALIAASRVSLGLHYPTDVAAGAALGLLMAGFFLTL